jgi:hypothetical protein
MRSPGSLFPITKNDICRKQFEPRARSHSSFWLRLDHPEIHSTGTEVGIAFLSEDELLFVNSGEICTPSSKCSNHKLKPQQRVTFDELRQARSPT